MYNTALAEAVEKTLAEARICATVTTSNLRDPIVDVQINCGDWKHDHRRADYLIKQLGGVLFFVQVTDSDGSDCYSARRSYVFPNGLIESQCVPDNRMYAENFL